MGGCLLILISIVAFFIFPPLGILLFLVGILASVMDASKSSSQNAQATRELKRIALLSAPPEVQAAEAKRELQERKNKQIGALVVLGIGAVLGFIGWVSHVSSPTTGTTATETTTTATASPTPLVSEATPTPQAEVEKDARQQQDREQQWTKYEPNQKVASGPIPSPAKLTTESAEADLNRAWQLLTSQQRDRLSQEERNWTRHRDSLPVEARIKSTADRAKYISSFVERTFDN
jgi:hypothetical protein